MQSKHTSNAQWPIGQFPSGHDVTTDSHDSEQEAESVCEILERDGWGGERKVFPLKTWTEEVDNGKV